MEFGSPECLDLFMQTKHSYRPDENGELPTRTREDEVIQYLRDRQGMYRAAEAGNIKLLRCE